MGFLKKDWGQRIEVKFRKRGIVVRPQGLVINSGGKVLGARIPGRDLILLGV